MRHRTPGLWVFAMAALTLAGCEGAPFSQTPAQARLQQPSIKAAPPLPDPAPVPASSESNALRAYFLRVAEQLQAQGLLRQEGAPSDAPFNARHLTENFVRIALYDEYQSRGGVLLARQTPARLRRWQEPVRINVEFGASVPTSQRQQDRASITALAEQISAASGHSVTVSSVEPNFTVMVLNDDERRTIAPRLEALVPGIDRAATHAVNTLSPATFCLVFAFSEPDTHIYSRAIAIVRGEHPDILRLSCFHEEIAQGMGLANDSPQARPSIFNDDEEFALLTRHDELLLKILYDPRLRPGMNEAEARPIVQTIAASLLGGES